MLGGGELLHAVGVTEAVSRCGVCRERWPLAGEFLGATGQRNPPTGRQRSRAGAAKIPPDLQLNSRTVLVNRWMLFIGFLG